MRLPRAAAFVVTCLGLLACGSSDDRPEIDMGTGGAAVAGSSGGAGTEWEGGSSGGGTVPVGANCTQTPCVSGAVCELDPCDAQYPSDCPSTCKRVVPACGPQACLADEYCTPGGEHGYCSPRAEADAACDGARSDSCVAGYYCAQDAKNPYAHRCVKRSGPGEPCTTNVNACVDGYRCDYHEPRVCVARTALHGACMNTFECESGLFCSADTEACEVVSQAGGDCRPSGESCSFGECKVTSDYCAEGLWCVPKASHSGCFHDEECAGMDDCCADQDNAGSCTPYGVKCLRPLGICSP